MNKRFQGVIRAPLLFLLLCTATILAACTDPPQVNRPAPFSFAAVNDAELGELVTSASATLSGLTAPVQASVSGAEAILIVNGVDAGTNAQVEAGDAIAIRLTASDEYDATVTATATVAGVSGTFSVTTMSLPGSPVITAFSSDPEIVRAGSTIDLQWSIGGGVDEILITNDRGLPEIDASSETSVSVELPANRPTITFTLTAYNTDTGESDSQDLILDLTLWACTDNSSPITFTDPGLETVIRTQLGFLPEVPIQCTNMQTLTTINTGHFDGNPGDITSLEGLQHATNLVHLDAQYNEIDDAEPIAGLTSLEVINFDRNEILDLEPFRQLVNLRELGLWDNGPVDNEGDDGISDLEPLSGLTNLEILYLSSNNISDLTPLGGLVNLELLWVMNNRILDLGPVANLTSMRSFRVGWNQGGSETGFARITDITALAGLPNLAWLGLEWAAITNTTPLSSLPSLYALSLEGNRISSVSTLVDNMDFPLIPTTPLPFAPADPTLNVVEHCLDTDPASADSADIAELELRGIVVLGFTPEEQASSCLLGGGASTDRLRRERSLQGLQGSDNYR